MGQSSSQDRRRDHHHYQNPPPPRPYYSDPSSTTQANYYSHYAAPNPGGGWRPAMVQPPPPPPLPPPFVEHQQAKTVKNGVNVHKDTLQLVIDESNPDQHLVSFTFDALTDGSVTIYYFAKEGSNCTFFPTFPDMYTPTKVPFQKGLGQKFRQPSGSGIDLGFFELDDLLKPLQGDVFPLVIYAEGSPLAQPTDEQSDQSMAATTAQITQAVIGKYNNDSFEAKVIKQILWLNGERYELQEIFGLVNSAAAEPGDDGGSGDDDMGKECVICLSEPRDTAVFPCRHLCMCSECAKLLRLQSNNCPICRQPVERLMEIKVSNADR